LGWKVRLGMMFVLYQISKMCAGLDRVRESPIYPAQDTGEAVTANSTASLEYIRVEENRQRNTAS
jgi:hypothetical protein